MSHGTVALLAAILAILLLLATIDDIGLTWDEPAYISASESYVNWLGELLARPGDALSTQQIECYWKPNHEHPPADKVWSGLIWSAARFICDDLTAHRLGNILLAGLLVALLYLMMARNVGRVAGLAAVAALLTMPRFFFHAHLAALDVPVACAIFAVVFLFWHTRDRRELKWTVWLGLIWGLALATKVNAVFLLPILLLWAFLFRRRLHVFRRIVLMGLLGLCPLLFLWPWLYHDSANRLMEYLGFLTTQHWPIPQWYLGQLYTPPPWHFPFVITIAVVPLTLTVLSIVGIARMVGKEPTRALGALLLLCAVVPMLVLASGQSVIYDNDRLLMPVFPFIAALAGIGFDWVLKGMRRAARCVVAPAWKWTVVLILGGITFIPQIGLSGRLYPHLLSYYSETIGGLPGAVRLGLETTYWCETYSQALPYLNAHALPGATVWAQDWSHDVLLYYQLHGKLRRDLRIAWRPGAKTVFAHKGMRGWMIPIRSADYVVLQQRQSGFTRPVENRIRGRKPVYQLNHHGVPLMEIYGPAAADTKRPRTGS